MGLHVWNKGSRGESLGFLFRNRFSDFLKAPDVLVKAGEIQRAGQDLFVFSVLVFLLTFFWAVSPRGPSSRLHPLTAEDSFPYTLSQLREKVRGDGDVLIGAPAGLVESLMETPELIRVDGPVSVWQYRTSACVFDLYMSTNTADAGQSAGNVLYSEVRSRDQDASAPKWSSCIPELLERPITFAALDAG